MSNKKNVWSVIWTVIEFILTLGLSHIKKHKSNKPEDNATSEKTNN